MEKTLTKEQLAAKLEGYEYGKGIPTEIFEATKANNLVIIHGASDDRVEFLGAIIDEVSIADVIQLSRSGVPGSDCDRGEDCPYFQHWIEEAIKYGKVRQIRVFWSGESGGKMMDAAKYSELGNPTWCFETDMPHAVFSMYDTYGDSREYFCRCMVIDLDEVWPALNYTQYVMEGGG